MLTYAHPRRVHAVTYSPFKEKIEMISKEATLVAGTLVFLLVTFTWIAFCVTFGLDPRRTSPLVSYVFMIASLMVPLTVAAALLLKLWPR